MTATSSFVIPTGTISGSSKTVLKDTVVPQAPTSDTLGGQYDASQHVSLSLPTGEDSASTIHYTTDGSTPLGYLALGPADRDQQQQEVEGRRR